jgi:hypothetical protein
MKWGEVEKRLRANLLIGKRVLSPEEALAIPDYQSYVDRGVLIRQEVAVCSECGLRANIYAGECDHADSVELDIRYVISSLLAEMQELVDNLHIGSE